MARSIPDSRRRSTTDSAAVAPTLTMAISRASASTARARISSDATRSRCSSRYCDSTVTSTLSPKLGGEFVVSKAFVGRAGTPRRLGSAGSTTTPEPAMSSPTTIAVTRRRTAPTPQPGQPAVGQCREADVAEQHSPRGGRVEAGRHCIRVDLPEPDGPVIAVSRGRPNATPTPSNARTCAVPRP
jgi:hypothetical protein